MGGLPPSGVIRSASRVYILVFWAKWGEIQSARCSIAASWWFARVRERDAVVVDLVVEKWRPFAKW